MKTMRVITIVCWIITAIALAGIAVWFISGTVFGFMSDRWGGWNFGMNIGGYESLAGPFSDVGNRSVDATGINSIKIEWVAGDIRITPHDENDIRITELAQRELRGNEKFYVGTLGDTLTIRYTERNLRGNLPQKQLEILIPRELSENMQIISIDTVSSSVTVTDIYATTLKCETVSGSMNFSGVFANTNLNSMSGRVTMENLAQNAVVNAETVSGKMEISGNFNNVGIETVSGNVSVTSTITPLLLKANSISGSITIAIPNDATISVNHSSVSGRLSSDIPVIMESKGAQFEISTVSGSAKILALG